MTDKKFTDEELISSLEVIATTRNCNECKIRNCKWGTCNCSQITANAALDLINRQKAEIERLKECPKCVYEYDGEVTEYCVQGHCSNFKTVEQIKAEAYKEFAERLKDAFPECNRDSEWVHLPCKVEQQLWFVENGEVKASTVDRLVYEELSTDDIFTRIDGYGFSVFFEDVGKTVFLTREEAEKALEGMKEDG